MSVSNSVTSTNVTSTTNEVPATSSLAPLAAAAIQQALAKPAISFVGSSSDANLATISGRILAGMTANAAYPAPVPSLDKLTAARNAFIDAVNANDGGTVAIAVRDKARKQLGLVLRDLALYVQHHCQGDLVTLLSSGYPAQRRRGGTLQVAPGTPARVRFQAGSLSGQLDGLCDKVDGAVLYQWRYATAQAPTVYTLTDTESKARVILESLVPGTQYLVQVRACGRRGSSDWSDPVAVYAV